MTAIATESSHSIARAIGDPSPAAIWHRSAPQAVRKAYEAGRQSAGWKAWRRHLRVRKRPVNLDGWGGHSCLPWTGKNACPTSDVLQTLHAWLRDAAGGPPKLDYALSALAWCRRLPGLAAVLPAGDWWRLLDHLLGTVAEADAAGGGELFSDEPLIQQLLAGELALTLAYLFPEITACRQRLPAARRALSAGLTDLVDGKGLLHARHFDRLRPLLACWTRCRALSARLRHGRWSRQAEKQYRQLTRNALRLTRRDGTHVFSDPSTDVGPESDLALAGLALSEGGTTDRRRPGTGVPKAAIHSEWAAAAVLRPDWSRSAPRLTVLYPSTSCRVELACGKDVLFSGPWTLDVRIDGVPAAPNSEWDESCWVSDDDVDYLELELELGEGLRIERHMLLARKDRFLLLADSVLGSRRATIDYRGTLPLCPDMTFREACDSRRGVLAGRKPRATLLPLALPERLADPCDGRLVSTGAGLELRQTAVGRALFAPLFFDLDRGRRQKRLTWRPLTVAASWAIEPADAAVGYRAAIGEKQWLIYRSLAKARNRSLLGHNLISQMLVARFGRKGEVESLIEIE